MISEYIKNGVVEVEVTLLGAERLLNNLWSQGIRVEEVRKLAVGTMRFKVNYTDYKEIEKEVKKLKGKIKIVKTEGVLFYLIRIKRKLSLAVGLVLFLFGLYILSTYVWAIEITTQKNVAPFEIRQELNSLGIKPGMSKSKINVYEIEKSLENIDGEILWIRARIEGSTLKVLVEEKVNPPKNNIGDKGEVLAKKDGEVKRIYTQSGKPAVKGGDMVKAGDVLIYPLQGKEGIEYEVKPRGNVIANIFYEKVMEIQVEGTKPKRTGEKEREIYLNFFGKKIYLKKAINNFESYDKIEGNKGFFNSNVYYEKKEMEVKVNRDELIKKSEEELSKSLEKNLSNDSKIIDQKTTIEDVGDGKIHVRVSFVVEEDIA
ncbi:MAG: sporulation protein YqfD [Clostridium sp.]